MIEQRTSNEVRVSKRCPNCGWRVLDKITPTAGIIELKCSRCGKPVRIDLSYRISYKSSSVRHRLSNSYSYYRI